MRYQPSKNDHGLPFCPFKSCVVPRPIGWISTTSIDGIDNLAPYSQFQNLTFDPPMVLFCANQTPDGKRKDSVVNAEQRGQFVWNMATYELREAMNLSSSSSAPEVDEFQLAGLEKAPSELVIPPRVAASPISFECEYVQTVRIPGNPPMGTVDLVIGKVLMVHIDDAVITPQGKLDIARIQPLARLGYYDYTAVTETFEMVIPGNDKALLRGLEGSPEQR